MEHEPTSPNKESPFRSKRFKRALAGLLIGGGVLATGTYITLEHILNDTPSVTHEDPNLQENPNYDNRIPPDSWPDIPKTQLPPPTIISPDEWGVVDTNK